PQVDAALAVLLLGFGERREALRYQRAHVAVVVACLAVELVRNERERDAIGPVEMAQDLEQCAPEPGVAGRVGGKRRCEVRSVEVTGGRAERRGRGVLGSIPGSVGGGVC